MYMRAMAGRLSLVAGFAFVAAACGGAVGAPDAFTVMDSAGVEHARNRVAASDTVMFMTPAVRIGVEDGAAEYLFEYISDVEPLSDGSVVVVDNRGARVALFDGTGSWLRDIGRRGEGPGEYRAPLRAWEADGELDVWDPVVRRLSRFAFDGAVRSTERLTWKSPSTPLVRLGDHWVDQREWGQQMQPGPAGAAVVRLAEDGAVLDTIVGPYPVPRVGWEIVDSVTGSGVMVNPPTFSARPLWTVAGDRLTWTPADEPRVDVYDSDGRHVRSIHLPREQEPVTTEVREVHARRYQARFGMDEESFASMRDDPNVTALLPTVSGLRTDDEERIWIAAFEPGLLGSETGRRWDVVDADGRLVLHVEFPDGFQLMRVRGGRAFGVSVLPSGVQGVDVFELEGSSVISSAS